MPISIGKKDVTTKIADAVVHGTASEASLRKLLKEYSPAQRLKIATEVVNTVKTAESDDAGELRDLSKRLNEFGQFVLEGRGEFFPHTHHSFWMDAGDDLDRKANVLEGRFPEEGISTT